MLIKFIEVPVLGSLFSSLFSKIVPEMVLVAQPLVSATALMLALFFAVSIQPGIQLRLIGRV